MLVGEGVVRQRFADPFPHQLGGRRQLQGFELGHHRFGLLLGGLAIFLGVDRLEHRRHLLDLALGHHREDVAVEVHHAPLPLGLGIVLGQRFDQAEAFVRDDQLGTLQAAFLQIGQEATPARFVFLAALGDPQDVTIAVLAHPDRHQHSAGGGLRTSPPQVRLRLMPSR